MRHAAAARRGAAHGAARPIRHRTGITTPKTSKPTKNNHEENRNHPLFPASGRVSVFADPPPGISPPAVRADGLDQPERRMDLHVRFRRKRPGTRLRRLEGIRRQNHRAVRPGEQALGRRPHGLHRPHLVPAYDRHSGRLVGTQRDAQLRSRVLHLRGVCRRPLRRTPLRRQHVVLLRHHRIREAGRQPQSGRLRHERPAQRQTDCRQTVAAIRLAQLRLHPHDRHLADGVDGGCAPALYREPAHRAAV